MRRTVSLLVLGLLAGVFAIGIMPAAEPALSKKSEAKKAESKGPSTEAKERARKTVRMLDDVYKTAVVLITDKYVNSEKDFPAGSAAIALFSEIQKKGWHDVRLIDVSGEPYEPKNVAQDAFEKQAVGALKAGKGYVEEVIEKDGKPYLRAMTAIPVVMKKCTMCHPNYEKAKPGEAVGAISYTLPIE